MSPSDQVSSSILRAVEQRGIGVVAYLTAGFPTPETFLETATAVAAACDVLEIGIPFSDPLADGPTIQMSSAHSMANGTTPISAIESIGRMQLQVPVVAMTYINPLLAMGVRSFSDALAVNGFAGAVVPDLPFEVAGSIAQSLEANGLAYCGLVTPFTPEKRVKAIVSHSTGFVYAVTSAGTTGSNLDVDRGVRGYLERVRRISVPTPTAAGFGIRHTDQVINLIGSTHAVIIGSALIEALAGGGDPVGFLNEVKESLAGVKTQ